MKRLTTALLALALATPAIAHDDATLDAMESPNGGQVRMAGPYHFELVLGTNELSVYLSDHGNTPVPSAGVSGSVILLSGGRTTLDLNPVGDNRLTGQGTFATTQDMKAVVLLTFPDGNAWQARFTPGDPRPGQSATTAAAAGAEDGHAHPH
jgi:hypothetical protein